MPMMISLRNFVLRTTSGHTIKFEAKKPAYVAPEAMQAAMTAGCVPENAEDAPFYDNEQKAKVEFSGGVRDSVIFLTLTAIAKENNSKNFDGGGFPKLDVVSDRVGFDVNKKEVTRLYQQYVSAKQEGLVYEPHPQAHMVLRVVEATTLTELKALADEYNYPKDKIAGLTAKQVRKLLLTKLSGVPVG